MMTTQQASLELTLSQRRARRYAVAAFLLGVLSLAIFFLTQGPTPAGWGPVLLLLGFPTVFGVTGIIFGMLSRRYVWVVLNSLIVMSFPLLMFVGSLVEAMTYP
ncbi:hypothetical protein [Yaniella halotolerans]|uniref:hypothetical protein n=1 Tax=Yaniella halotolerans TaxID=225453 RepID=UPI0003B4A2C0|nr:hypothetical protein [Yaniella halotolerans]